MVVIVIGGNSLIKSNGQESVEDQYQAVYETCLHIADMIEQGWTVAIGHGNGPQVGFILRRSEIAHQVERIHEVPLDVCGADTQAATGYMLQQILYYAFRRRGIDRKVATVVTPVELDPRDPAFQNPTKPIGSFVEAAQALEKKEKEGWFVVEDAGRGWRRGVPSPLPKRVVEEPIDKGLINLGMCVITVGGGGIPVVADETGKLIGIAVMIDHGKIEVITADAKVDARQIIDAGGKVLLPGVVDVHVHGDEVACWLEQREETLEQVLQVWESIEGLAASLAAFHALDDALPKVRSIVEEQCQRIREISESGDDNYDLLAQLDTAWHRAIASASGNDIANELISHIIPAFNECNKAFLYVSRRMAKMEEEHRAISNALESREPVAAERGMRDHISRVRNEITTIKYLA